MKPPSAGNDIAEDDSPPLPPQLKKMAASAQRVFRCIRDEGPITHADLHAKTRIPPRTIRFAVRRLRENNLLQARLNLLDCRTCLFFVHPDYMTEEETARTARRLMAKEPKEETYSLLSV